MADNTKKLLLHKAKKALVLNAPAAYQEFTGHIPEGVAVSAEVVSAEEGTYDFVLFFTGSIAQLDEMAPEALRALMPGGLLWVAYPKKSSKIKTDINRDISWKPFTEANFAPVTQISLDDTWSALRFRPLSEIKVMTRKTIVPGQKE